MKTTLFTIFALGASFLPARGEVVIAGNRAVTVGGYYACMNEEWFHDISTFYSAKDVASIKAYYAAFRCFDLGAGMDATVMGYGGMFSGAVQIAVKGHKVWTATEAIKAR